MYEQFGRRLKTGVKARVLAKPYRPIGKLLGLPLRPTQELVGQVVEVVDAHPKYYETEFCPSITIKDAKGQIDTLDINYLRVVKV